MCPYEVPRSHVVFPLLLQLIQAAYQTSYQTERDARMRESSPNEESLLVLRVWGRRRLTDS